MEANNKKLKDDLSWAYSLFKVNKYIEYTLKWIEIELAEAKKMRDEAVERELGLMFEL